MRYDPQQMADLRAREATLRERVATLSTQMHDRRESNQTWSPELQSAHERDSVDHGVATRDLQLVMADVQAMEDVRPRSRQENQSVLNRFLRGGLNAIGEDANPYAELAAGHEWIPRNLQNAEMLYIPSPRESRELRREMFGNDLSRAFPNHQMVLDTDTTAGRSLAPISTSPDVIDTLDYMGSPMEAFARFQSGTGAPMRVPQFDAASQKGRILAAQGSTVNAQQLPDPTNVEFTSRTGTSDFIDIAIEAETDAVFDVVGYGFRQCNRRLIRAWSEVLTDNAYNATPMGAVGSAKVSSQETSVTGSFNWEELIDLEYQVNRAYRDPMGEGVGGGFVLNGQGMRGYMISDGAERLFKKLKDTQNRPLYLPSLAAGIPPTFDGQPVVVNGFMDAPASGVTTAVAYGNFASFGLREIGGVAIFRFFDSATAATYSSRIVAFNRMDGKVRLPLESNANPAIARMDIK